MHSTTSAFRQRPFAVSAAALLILVTGLAGASARANLVSNGSFESPTVPLASFTNFLAGSTAITGWTVVGVDSAVSSGSFIQSGITFEAQEGVQFIDLAGITSNNKASGVTQSFTTTAGSSYQVSFYVGSATNDSLFFASTVDLSIDSGPRTSFTNPTAPHDSLNWAHFTSDFVATAPTTAITFFNGSEPDNFLGGLDNVDVELISAAVPEPSEVLLLALGLAALVSSQRFMARPGRAGP